jgi:hypothetical protein
MESESRRRENAWGCIMFILAAGLIMFAVDRWGSKIFSSDDAADTPASSVSAASPKVRKDKDDSGEGKGLHSPGFPSLPGGLNPPRRCLSGIKKIPRDSVNKLFVDQDGDLATTEARTAKKLDPAERMRFRNLVQDRQFLFSVPRDPMRPIDDERLAARLDRAKRAVLSADAPPCAWRWDGVRALVEKHGGRLILKGYGTTNPYSAEKSANGRWWCSEFEIMLKSGNELANESDLDLARSMVNNATHVLADELAMNFSGYDVREFAFARMSCTGFSAVLTLLEGLVRIWNSVRFLDALQGEIGTSEASQAMDKFDRGDPVPLLKKVALITAKFMDGLEEKGIALQMSGGWHCSFPPITRGPRQDWEFYPLDIDDPLINLLERELLKFGSDVISGKGNAL